MKSYIFIEERHVASTFFNLTLYFLIIFYPYPSGKPKPSPKRTTRCNLASLNIHAVSSSSEESDDEDLSKPLFEPPRSKQLTR